MCDEAETCKSIRVSSLYSIFQGAAKVNDEQVTASRN